MKFRSKNEWLTILENQKNTGLTIASYCQQNNIPTASFYNARVKLLDKSTNNKSSFIQATFTPQSSLTPQINKTEQVILSPAEPIKVITSHAKVELPIDWARTP